MLLSFVIGIKHLITLCRKGDDESPQKYRNIHGGRGAGGMGGGHFCEGPCVLIFMCGVCLTCVSDSLVGSCWRGFRQSVELTVLKGGREGGRKRDRRRRVRGCCRRCHRVTFAWCRRQRLDGYPIPCPAIGSMCQRIVSWGIIVAGCIYFSSTIVIAVVCFLCVEGQQQRRWLYVGRFVWVCLSDGAFLHSLSSLSQLFLCMFP